MQKRWIILFAALLILSLLGLVYSDSEGVFTDLDPNLNFADVAWMITATIFVLMMTPGLSFFYGGMVRAKNVISTIFLPNLSHVSCNKPSPYSCIILLTTELGHFTTLINSHMPFLPLLERISLTALSLISCFI